LQVIEFWEIGEVDQAGARHLRSVEDQDAEFVEFGQVAQAFV